MLILQILFKNYFIVFAACVLALAACSKDKNKRNPTCYWTVNGEGFQSNDTYLEEGKAQTNFGVNHGLSDRMGFTFWFQGVPRFGSLFISNVSIQDPATVSIGLKYHGVFYAVRDHLNNEVTSSEYNDNARLQFQDVWFRNKADSTDTVLVSCDFYAP